MPTKVSLDDLEIAVMWVSSGPEFEPAAFVSLRTGRIFSRGSDGPIEEDYPPGDAWHAYESDATVRALTLWAQEQGLEVVSNSRGSSSSR